MRIAIVAPLVSAIREPQRGGSQAFVSDLAERNEHVVIVQAVVSIARALGMTTTAEGVETEGQHRFLTALGCDEVQGYLFSAPVPADKLPELLAKWDPETVRAA